MDKWKLVLGFLIYTEFVLCQDTTEETREACPAPFTEFDATCYLLNATTCPYHLPLPFERQIDIAVANNITAVKLNATKIPNYDYFRWDEIQGNYGKLFTDELEIADDRADNIVADLYNASDISYTMTDENVSYVCAYDSLMNQPIMNYCRRFDEICANGTDLESDNCHCACATHAHFCELACDNYTQSNESVCVTCNDTYEKYKNPRFSLDIHHEKNAIFVAVLSFLKLLPIDGGDVSVYCYTDARNSLHDITYRYNGSEFEIYGKSYRDIYYKISPLEGVIGHYWCEGFQWQGGEVFGKISETIIMEDASADPSFTMNVTLNYTISYPLENEIVTDPTQYEYVTQIRFLHLYEINQTTGNTTTLSYRVYYNRTTEVDIHDVFDDVRNVTLEYYDDVKVSPSYCLPDTTVTLDNMTLSWPQTLVGMTTIPNELCLKNDSKPVTRKCLGEYLYGTYWSEVDGSCVNDSEIFGSAHTKSLHDLRHSAYESATKINDLRQLLTNRTTLITVDVHFMAVVFENVTRSTDRFNLSELIEVASDIMDVDRGVLRDAQLLLNSTDLILYSLDMILGNYAYADDGDYFTAVTRNIYLQVSKFSAANITGVAFYDTAANVKVTPLFVNTSRDDFDTGELTVAAFISKSQLDQVTRVNNGESRLVIIAFRHGSLFNSQDDSPRITGHLLGIYVTNFEEPYMAGDVTILTRPDRKYRANLQCYQWEYGRNKIWYNTHGLWKYDTDAVPYRECYSCSHSSLQHFGILVGREDDVALSIVTIVGCAFSMCGSMAVIVTGVIYKNWREKSGTKILLNFVLTNMTQNVILAASSGIDSYTQILLCKIIGACLHYSVLSQFTWMMIIGYLQYLRYVRVFYTVETRFIVASSVAAWILPVIPVITVLSIETSYYVQDDFCYLQDTPLFLAVFLPVSFTLMANTIIFGLILFNIYFKNNDSRTGRDSMSWLNIRLVVLLFFLLGLYWLFGIAARFTKLAALDYFFCISAALQGLVVFLYFIVFNKMTRNFWLRQLKRSETISAMQIWLQQKRTIGRVGIDKSRTRAAKARMMKSLEKNC